MLLGEMIRELRESQNYTQKEFADLLNISKGCLSKYETGRTQPSIETLIKMADTLNVTLDYLVGRNACSIDYNVLKKPYIKPISGFAIINDMMVLDQKRRKVLFDLLQDLKHCTEYDRLYSKK